MGGVGKVIKHAASDFGSIITGGVVNLDKGRFNVPFSSAAMRDYAKGYGNMFTGGQMRNTVNSALDSKAARIAGTVTGTLAGAAAGAGVGGALGAGASAGGAASGGASVLGVSPQLAGAAAGGYAAQSINAAGDAKQKIESETEAQRTLDKQKSDALRAAEDAALAVQTKQAEERRRRSGKQAQTVLTGSSGLGGGAPTYTQTLQPGSPRKSVLG